MIHFSSGSTGAPTLWPRTVHSELEVAVTFERVLKDAFKADTQPTLCVVAFPLDALLAVSCLGEQQQILQIWIYEVPTVGGVLLVVRGVAAAAQCFPCSLNDTQKMFLTSRNFSICTVSTGAAPRSLSASVVFAASMRAEIQTMADCQSS